MDSLECFTPEEVKILYEWYIESIYPDSIIQAGRLALHDCDNLLSQKDSSLAIKTYEAESNWNLYLKTEEQSQLKDTKLENAELLLNNCKKNKLSSTLLAGGGGILLGTILTLILIH